MKLQTEFKSFRFRLSSLFVFVSLVAIVTFAGRHIYDRAKIRQDATNVLESNRFDLEWKKGKNRVGQLDWHPYLESLYSVHNYNNSRLDISPDALQALTVFPELLNVDLSHSNIKDEDLHILASFVDLKNIDLSDNPSIMGSTLVGLRQLRGVISIDCGNTSVRDEELQFLSNCQVLTGLFLNGCPISDLGMKQIAKVHTLEFLSLNETRITVAGIEELNRLPGLRILYLEDTSLGDECATSLARYPALENLSLCDTRVSDRGMELLAKSMTLRYLDLNSCNISQSAINRLKQLRPTLVITK